MTEERFDLSDGSQLDLLVEGRIEAVDAGRQTRTAVEIIRRLSGQPGIILADEVGMGKTFVALAVAAATYFRDPEAGPVVVMVPPALVRKWPIDAGVFRKKCLRGRWQELFEFNEQPISNGIDFLKTLDDDPRERKRMAVVFITHGALYRSLADNWVRLAVLQQALHGRHMVDHIRRALSRFAGDLLRMKRTLPAEAWEGLLKRNPGEWLGYLKRNFKEAVPEDGDDPVPDHLWRAIQNPIYKPALDSIKNLLDEKIPRRRTANLGVYMTDLRKKLRDEIDGLWLRAKGHLGMRLPLLIFDEAHHLKNNETELVHSLFKGGDADSDSVKGAFHGVFSKMLFLTATPFQLGHYELLNVLHHFETVAWDRQGVAAMNLDGYNNALTGLQSSLDSAQEQALRLDQAWGQLATSDLSIGGQTVQGVDVWWDKANAAPDKLSEKGFVAFRQVLETERAMGEAESLLKPWIIRHLKPREMAFNGQTIQRRESFPGRAILDPIEKDQGLEIKRDSILPFLLAARTVAIKPMGRAVFAEGLASSYEAFLNTHNNRSASHDDDDDDADDQQEEDEPKVKRYADAIKKVLTTSEGGMLSGHPKVEATANKVLALWEKGEKVVVFCHYIETGKALQRAISKVIQERIVELAAGKMAGATRVDVGERLERYGERFFDADGTIRRQFDRLAGSIVDEYPSLLGEKNKLVDILRRFVRTPAYLARFFILNRDPDSTEVDAAFDTKDASDLSLRDVFRRFLEFLGVRCDGAERDEYLKAVDEVQTGTHRVTAKSFLSGEEQARAEGVLPNVRLANGKVRPEARRKLMLTFNTPFYPEILVASAVLAEGVDLHLNCRHIIHHDLCWNPSTLEQRTGRVDRIGAKAEKCHRPIEIYLPYISGTQDQRMFQVVMDRERWFKVVMGDEIKTDSATIERIADRVSLPASLADRLVFRLEA